MTIARLSRPVTYRVLRQELRVDRSEGWFSAMFKFTVHFLHDRFQEIIHLDERIMGDPQRLEIFAEAIAAKGPYSSIVGFIDGIASRGFPVFRRKYAVAGTKIKIGRPDAQLQRVMYNGCRNSSCFSSSITPDPSKGHKRMHCVLFQGVVTPDGMLVSFMGPYPGEQILLVVQETQVTRNRSKQRSGHTHPFAFGRPP